MGEKKELANILSCLVKCPSQLGQDSQEKYPDLAFLQSLTEVSDSVCDVHLNKDAWKPFRDSACLLQASRSVCSIFFSPLLSSGRVTPPSVPDSTGVILVLNVPSLFKLFSVL